MSNKTTITIKRPGWKWVLEAYNTINTASPNDEDLQEKFKQGIVENGKWRGLSQQVAEQKAQEVIERIRNGDSIEPDAPPVWQRYALVGGEPLREYINHKNFFGKSPDYPDYSNTCALRVSYALNYGGMPIKNYIPKDFGNIPILTGADKNMYITGVINLMNFLKSKNVWGNADEPYNPKFIKTRQESIDFYRKEFSNFSKKGVVGMIVSGWRNAQGHMTLWDGKNFLDGTNYLEYSGAYVLVKEIYFWELK